MTTLTTIRRGGKGLPRLSYDDNDNDNNNDSINDNDNDTDNNQEVARVSPDESESGVQGGRSGRTSHSYNHNHNQPQPDISINPICPAYLSIS